MVYLVEEGGRLCLPKSKEGLGFELEVHHEVVIQGEKVLFCKPLIDYYPKDWWSKDEIPLLDQVDVIVRKAVNTSLPRVVAEGVIAAEGKILLVKSKRGYTKGGWTLPGGFVGYGESPKEAVKREVEEEVGVECRVKSLLGVESFLGKKTYFHWHMFFYEVELVNHEFKPAPDEIEKVEWFELKEATERLGEVMGKKLKEFSNKRRERK